MRDDKTPTGLAAHLDRFDRFSDGADLIQLDEDGVGRLLRDTLPDKFGVGDIDVVSDNLHAFSQRGHRPRLQFGNCHFSKLSPTLNCTLSNRSLDRCRIVIYAFQHSGGVRLMPQPAANNSYSGSL